MANIDPTQFDSYEEYAEYMQYVNSTREQAAQKAAPQPFQEASKQNKAKIESGEITQDPASRVPPQNRMDWVQGQMDKYGPSREDIGAALSGGVGTPGMNVAGQVSRTIPKWATKNAATRIATQTGVGAAGGAIRPPEEDESRGLNAIKGGIGGFAAGTIAEAIPAAYNAGRGLYRLLKGDSVAKQEANLQGLIRGKSTSVDPSRLEGSPKALDDINKLHQNEYGVTPASKPGPQEVDMPLEWALNQKRALDNNKYSELTGLPLRKSDAELAAANYLRSKLHGESPEISTQLTEMADTINSKNMLERAYRALNREGAPMKAAGRAATAVVGSGVKGGLRSLQNPKDGSLLQGIEGSLGRLQREE